MKVPAFIHLFASVYAATRCSVDFYAYEVVRHLLPQLYDRVMQDPANEFRRIPIPRTRLNKGMKEGRSAWPRPRCSPGDQLAVQIPRSCFFLASKSSLVMMP
jgi:hypothetical protein